jgi:hypothetical protein
MALVTARGGRLTSRMLFGLLRCDFTDAVFAVRLDVSLSHSRMEGPLAGTTEAAKRAASWKDAWHSFDCTVSGLGGPITGPFQGLARD